MSKRRRLRASGAQDGRSERPASGCGQPRARPTISAKKTRPAKLSPRGPCVNDSGDTYSRACGTTIGSGSLTTVFGMGTGVTFQIWSPEIPCRRFRDEWSPRRRSGECTVVVVVACFLSEARIQRAFASTGYEWSSVRPLVPVS